MVLPMLTHNEICDAIRDAATRYPIKTAYYFGSYADGTQREDSDLDLLVDFTKSVSIFTLARLSNDLEARLRKPVDVLGLPLPTDTYLVIDKQVKCYGE